MLKGDVFTEDVLSTWIEYKRTAEVDAAWMRPHPHEFELYFDVIARREVLPQNEIEHGPRRQTASTGSVTFGQRTTLIVSSSRRFPIRAQASADEKTTVLQRRTRKKGARAMVDWRGRRAGHPLGRVDRLGRLGALRARRSLDRARSRSASGSAWRSIFSAAGGESGDPRPLRSGRPWPASCYADRAEAAGCACTCCTSRTWVA